MLLFATVIAVLLVGGVQSDCMYTPGTTLLRDVQLMSTAGGNWPLKIGGYTHTPLRIQYVRGSETYTLYNIWTAPSGTSAAKCKANAACAPMNKWFWIEGHSDSLTLGKDGAAVDASKRKYVALNVGVNYKKSSAGKYVWRLDCNKCCS